MKDLIVAATYLELAPFLNHIGYTKIVAQAEIVDFGKFDLLITGIGQTQTTFSITRAITKGRYSCLLNFGIAGSFKKKTPIRSMVIVAEEIFADLGAENNDGEFLDLFEMGLNDANKHPFKDGKLQALIPESFTSAQHLPKVRSVTVNRVLSHANSIKWVEKKYAPDVVNMEGAAVFYACIMSELPCLQLRTISDFVGTRDKASWDIKGAVETLNQEVIRIYEQRYKLS